MSSATGAFSDAEGYSPRERSAPESLAHEVFSGIESLAAECCIEIYRLMARTRALEERSLKMSKSGEGFFWVGGPGEEAFNVCMGMQILKGRGPSYDYIHLHYRSAGVMLAMGMSMKDHLRQMAMTFTDRHSRGRNFVGHYAAPEWNVVPVTSVIEVQYVMAPGTAMVQKRHGGKGISIVTGGDAGTAEGDFTSCMVWSTRPGNELPVMMVVTNNGWGISTPASSQHGESHIADRGGPFNIPSETVDGNDPIAAWHAIDRGMSYCRRMRRPFLLEAKVSRLNGHSSSSGANRVAGEIDCVVDFEHKLIELGVADEAHVESIRRDAREEAERALEEIINEPRPRPEDVERFTYAASTVDAVYPGDYTGLPGSGHADMATLVQAIRLALHYGEEHLGVTDIFGEDVGPPLGGVFTATQGLRTTWNTPLDERGIVGAAMGIAYAGGRPVFEIQFCDYAFNIFDLLKVAGNQRWCSGGAFDMPLVMMTPVGSGIRGSVYHSHSFESWAVRMAGWKIVMPSCAIDAYGLMLSAIVDPNPVMMLMPKALLRVRGEKKIPGEPEDEEELKQRIDAPVGDRSNWKPDWPEVRPHFVPIGKAERVREGDAATIISYGRMLPLCAQAAEDLNRSNGLNFEVIDLRSIFPYDWDMIRESILKTGRVLLVNEDTEVCNFGEHLLRRIVDEHFYDLLVKPRIIMGKHVPGVGLNPIYEQNTVPQYGELRETMLQIATEGV